MCVWLCICVCVWLCMCGVYVCDRWVQLGHPGKWVNVNRSWVSECSIGQLVYIYLISIPLTLVCIVGRWIDTSKETESQRPCLTGVVAVLIWSLPLAMVEYFYYANVNCQRKALLLMPQHSCWNEQCYCKFWDLCLDHSPSPQRNIGKGYLNFWPLWC